MHKSRHEHNIEAYPIYLLTTLWWLLTSPESLMTSYTNCCLSVQRILSNYCTSCF